MKRSNLRKCNLFTGERYGQTCVSLSVCLSGCIFLTALNALCGVDAPAHCSKDQQWPTWTEAALTRHLAQVAKYGSRKREAHHQRQHPTHETQVYHSSALHHRGPKGRQMACEIVQNCEVKYLEKPARLDGSPVFLLWKSRLRSFSSWYFETPSRWPAQEWKFQKHSRKLPETHNRASEHMIYCMLHDVYTQHDINQYYIKLWRSIDIALLTY